MKFSKNFENFEGETLCNVGTVAYSNLRIHVRPRLGKSTLCSGYSFSVSPCKILSLFKRNPKFQNLFHKNYLADTTCSHVCTYFNVFLMLVTNIVMKLCNFELKCAFLELYGEK